MTTEKVTAQGLGLLNEAPQEDLTSRSHSLCEEEIWLIWAQDVQKGLLWSIPFWRPLQLKMTVNILVTH